MCVNYFSFPAAEVLVEETSEFMFKWIHFQVTFYLLFHSFLTFSKRCADKLFFSTVLNEIRTVSKRCQEKFYVKTIYRPHTTGDKSSAKKHWCICDTYQQQTNVNPSALNSPIFSQLG